MIRHLFTLLWNQKKSYAGIILEQMMVFIVLMVCMISLCDAIQRYNDPGQLNTSHTLTFGYVIRGSNPQVYADMASAMGSIVEHLNNLPYVDGICESMSFIPYVRPKENYRQDSVKLANQKFWANIKYSEADARRVFALVPTEGTWLPDGILPNGFYPAVVTQQFVDLARLSQPIGKQFEYDAHVYEIVGVIPGVKESVFEEASPAVILPIQNTYASKSSYREFCARTQPGYENAFFNEYNKAFSRLVTAPDVDLYISDLNRRKRDNMIATTTEVAFLAIPSMFLFLFAFIGTLGLFLLHMKTRTVEFALRMALGARRNRMVGFVVMESITVSIVAMVPGLVLALFIYEFTLTNLIAIMITFLMMLLFSVLSAWYPAYSVSKINPAISLHYE